MYSSDAGTKHPLPLGNSIGRLQSFRKHAEHSRMVIEAIANFQLVPQRRHSLLAAALNATIPSCRARS